MSFKISPEILEIGSKNKKRRVWKRFVTCLAAIVVFCTTYALILPAITSDYKVVCGHVEHIHNDSCYDMQKVYVCDQEECQPHTHTDECYEMIYISLYEKEMQILRCGLEETEGHVHTENCIGTHSVLTCTRSVHEHSANCYAKQKGDPAADIETAADWQSSFQQVKLGDDWAANLVSIAESQLGYKESAENYILTSKNIKQGYNRYGAWYGSEYGDWDAMFVSFCLNYAKIKGVPFESKPQAWIEQLKSEEYLLYRGTSYSPAIGDLIFLNLDDIDGADNVGIISEIVPEKKNQPAQIKYIAKSEKKTVECISCPTDDTSIIGFAELPYNPKSTIRLTATTKSGVNVVLYGPISSFPDPRGEYILKVKELSNSKKGGARAYDALSKKVPKNKKDEASLHLFDITIWLNGEEIQPTGKLTLEFTDLANKKEAQIYHIDGNNAQEMNTNNTKNGAISTSTNHFSIYGIVMSGGYATRASSISEGQHGSGTFTINRTANGFLSSEYDIYRTETALGVAGSFHLVAFNELRINSHCNGNVLAKTAYANSNFGTNGFTNELSYIQDYAQINGNSASNNSHCLVIGSEATITLVDNGNAFAVNGQKLDRPKNIIQDLDTATTPFIDMEAAEAQVRYVSNYFAAQPNTSGITKNLSDMNNAYLSIPSNATGPSYYTMTISELTSVAKLDLKGFSSSNDASLIVTVDCQGQSEFSICHTYLWVDGQKTSTSEVTSFEYGRVLWNFINTSGVTVHTREKNGSVIALDGTVYADSNLNGTVIAQNINTRAETHRTDFIAHVDIPTPSASPSGTTPPPTSPQTTPTATPTSTPTPTATPSYVDVQFTAQKKLNNNNPTNTQRFNFILDSWDGNNWVQLQQKQNSLSNITFDNIRLTESKDYWYRISEPKGTATSYRYDLTCYYIKVTANTVNRTVTYTYYSATSKIEGPPNLSMLTPINGSSNVIFRNQTKANNTTDLLIKKRWQNTNSVLLSNSPVSYINVKIIQIATTTGSRPQTTESQYGNLITISAANNWQFRVTGLPTTARINRVTYNYTYRVEEQPINLSEYTITPTYSAVQNEEVTITNTVTRFVVLPETGGIGTITFIIGGAALMLCSAVYACAIIVKQRNRKHN